MVIKIKKNAISTSRLEAREIKETEKTEEHDYNSTYDNAFDKKLRLSRIYGSSLQSNHSNKWIVWVVVGGFAFVVLCFILTASMYSSNKKQRRVYRKQQYSRTQSRQQLKKYDELDGKTMGQWMNDNSIVTKDLKERQQRRLKHTYSPTK